MKTTPAQRAEFLRWFLNYAGLPNVIPSIPRKQPLSDWVSDLIADVDEVTQQCHDYKSAAEAEAIFADEQNQKVGELTAKLAAAEASCAVKHDALQLARRWGSQGDIELADDPAREGKSVSFYIDKALKDSCGTKQLAERDQLRAEVVKWRKVCIPNGDGSTLAEQYLADPDHARQFIRAQADELNDVTAELSRLQLRWSGEAPTKGNIYWFRASPSNPRHVVQVYESADGTTLWVEFRLDSEDLVDVLKKWPNCQWAGPLAEPVDGGGE